MLVSKAKVQAGEWVLIHGIGGGVSLAALQICNSFGARAIVTSHSEAKRDRAVELGAVHAVDYVDEDVVASVRELTDGLSGCVICMPDADDIARKLAWILDGKNNDQGRESIDHLRIETVADKVIGEYQRIVARN